MKIVKYAGINPELIKLIHNEKAKKINRQSIITSVYFVSALNNYLNTNLVKKQKYSSSDSLQKRVYNSEEIRFLKHNLKLYKRITKNSYINKRPIGIRIIKHKKKKYFPKLLDRIGSTNIESGLKPIKAKIPSSKSISKSKSGVENFSHSKELYNLKEESIDKSFDNYLNNICSNIQNNSNPEEFNMPKAKSNRIKVIHDKSSIQKYYPSTLIKETKDKKFQRLMVV